MKTDNNVVLPVLLPVISTAQVGVEYFYYICVCARCYIVAGLVSDNYDVTSPGGGTSPQTSHFTPGCLSSN